MAIATEEEFKGIHDRVGRIAGQKREFVELLKESFVATVYISKNLTKPFVEH